MTTSHPCHLTSDLHFFTSFLFSIMLRLTLILPSPCSQVVTIDECAACRLARSECSIRLLLRVFFLLTIATESRRTQTPKRTLTRVLARSECLTRRLCRVTLSLTAVAGTVSPAYREDAVQIPEEEACVCPLDALDGFLFANNSLVTDRRNAKWHQNKALRRETFEGFEDDAPPSDTEVKAELVSSDESSNLETAEKMQSDAPDSKSGDQAFGESLNGFPDDELRQKDDPVGFDESPDQKIKEESPEDGGDMFLQWQRTDDRTISKMLLATTKMVTPPTSKRRWSV